MEVNGRYPRLAMTWPCRGFDRAPFAPGLLACGWRRSTFTATHPAALFPPAQPTDCYAIVYRGRGLHQCPHQETHLPSTVRDGIPAHDLCRGSGTVLLSRCGRHLTPRLWARRDTSFTKRAQPKRVSSSLLFILWGAGLIDLLLRASTSTAYLAIRGSGVRVGRAKEINSPRAHFPYAGRGARTVGLVVDRPRKHRQATAFPSTRSRATIDSCR